MKTKAIFASFSFLVIFGTAIQAQAEGAIASSLSVCRTVVSGDNPWNLVRKMGGIVDRTMVARVLPRFMTDNEITNPQRLMPGQVVCFSEDMMPVASTTTSDGVNQVATSTAIEPALVPISAPLAWPVSSSRAAISQVFDLPQDHPAIDLAAASGTSLRASGDGVVTRVFEDEFDLTRCGNEVEIRYARHTLVYCHLATIDVKSDERVSFRTIIGTVGKTGNASGPHVHIVVADRTTGRAVDPFGVFDSATTPRLWEKAAKRRQLLLAVRAPPRPGLAIANAPEPTLVNLMRP